ncbi:MAG: hypothetical protein Kow00133_15130 [Amphiplicatus sp.]
MTGNGRAVRIGEAGRLWRRAGLASILFLALAPKAGAQTIFADDFEDGAYDGWTEGGTGLADVYLIGANHTVRLRQAKHIWRSVSTVGHDAVTVQMEMAASSLETGDICVGEASGDGGQTWIEIVRVENGQDDKTLFSGSVSAPVFAENPDLRLRGRAAGGTTGDYCYFDNVLVTGGAGGGGSPRAALDFATLNGAGSYAALVDYAAYRPAAGASAPSNTFSGALTFTGAAYDGGFMVHKDSFNYDAEPAIDELPAFSFEFVQDGGDFIPVLRGAQPSSHPNWEYIIGPGEAWDEPGDNGYTRVSFPFSLQEKNANCTHNGAMTFLFTDGGQVSDVAYQIAGETCLYFKFDMWGLVPANYSPGPVADAGAVKTAYQAEVAGRMPTKPIGDLAVDYPGADPAKFGSPAEVTPAHMSAYGFIIDGVHYVGGCETRAGAYPYCDAMDLPSYSTAKSAFAGVGLMRLEKLYPGVMQDAISLYVPECAADGDWSDVALEDALDMATGNYRFATYFRDEGSTAMTNFFLETTHAGRIDRACTQFPRKATPGTVWVYHTSDTYILGAAMQAFYRSQAGSSADIWADLVYGGLYQALGVSQTLRTTRRSYDSVAQPFTGWGLTYHRDDVAKIATFLNVDDAKIGGVSMLDGAEFDAAMQRVSADRGLNAGDSLTRYNNGFWAWNAGSWLGCAGDVWIPFMSGYGGITVALFPNGTTYYYFSDNDEFSWGTAITGAHEIAPMCQ